MDECKPLPPVSTSKNMGTMELGAAHPSARAAPPDRQGHSPHALGPRSEHDSPSGSMIIQTLAEEGGRREEEGGGRRFNVDRELDCSEHCPCLVVQPLPAEAGVPARALQRTLQRPRLLVAAQLQFESKI